MSSTRKKLLLIGWDSADWKIINGLLAEGGLDGVRSLMEGGVHGNLATLEPQLSPMLWTSIATGKMSYHHGVQGFTEVDPISGQVVPVSAASRKCKTVWEILEEQGKRCHVVSWFATQGEQDLKGKMVSNHFAHLRGVKPGQDPEEWPPPMPGTYWPEELEETMNQLRVSPHELDGEIMHPFLPQGAKIDQTKDRRIINLLIQMAEAFSVHTAATHLMETDPDWDMMAVYYRAIDEISHFFMAYHPPKMEGITEEDFELYQHVVKSTYRVHDMMLTNLLRLAGPDTTVLLVSDHGFHSDHLRPTYTPQVPAGITVWHRPQGVLLAKGPGIKNQNEPLFGARLLDITPSILHYFGLPAGEDMEGRVLKEIFEDQRDVEKIPSWEEAGESKRAHGSLSEEESQALLEQFVSLGYIDELSSNPSEAAEVTLRENKWNLARSYLYGGKSLEALPLLEDCVDACPERSDYVQMLARVQFDLHLVEEAEETIALALESFDKSFASNLLKAQIAQRKGRQKEALGILEELRIAAPKHPQIFEILCQCNLSLKNWDAAKETATSLAQLDPDSYQAAITLARAEVAQRRYSTASQFALQAIQLQFGDPRGHSLLGQSLQGMGQISEAIHAFSNCLKLNPRHRLASSALARLLRDTGELDKAAAVEAQVLRLRFEEKEQQQVSLQRLRKDITSRARARREQRSTVSENAGSPNGGSGEEVQSTSSFTLVSGLPRSGTSLMMQMLHAAGLEPMTDGKRFADEDNPEGYFEWEEIKQLPKNPALIEQAEGKVVKVISALLTKLPPRHRYRIIFMRRPMEEVVTSQWRMLERRGIRPRSEREHLFRSQQTHLNQVLDALRRHPRVELLEVDYPTLVSSPEPVLTQICEFLGDSLPRPDLLAKPIRRDLHRNQSK